MMKIWSEPRRARLREQIADAATIIWVWFWGSVIIQLYQFLAGFAEAGRTVHDGGVSMTQHGIELGDSLRGLPLAGNELSEAARGAFAAAGNPLADFGTSLADFIVVIATMFALLFALVTIVPWLLRYVPWRIDRLSRARAAHRAIRRAPRVSDPRVQKVLAMRAINRLDYPTLLEYTPDPIGDWTTGRHERLARAELASVGLLPG